MVIMPEHDSSTPCHTRRISAPVHGECATLNYPSHLHCPTYDVCSGFQRADLTPKQEEFSPLRIRMLCRLS